ncbi:MAG: DUF6334 family protein [Candidatus Sulfotelmatobacter sp.]|jgi:hypothetical protein
MASTKTRAAEALFPLLSSFHALNGLSLKAVRETRVDEMVVSIVLDFDSKLLILAADENNDTIELVVRDSSDSEQPPPGGEKGHSSPWQGFIQKKFGWGWVTINQQGYLDGVLLSFDGINPQLIVTVVASSLKVSHIDGKTRMGT